jgi:hypothetical protein
VKPIFGPSNASHGQNICGMAIRKAVEKLDLIGVPQQVDATLEQFLKLFFTH